MEKWKIQLQDKKFLIWNTILEKNEYLIVWNKMNNDIIFALLSSIFNESVKEDGTRFSFSRNNLENVKHIFSASLRPLKNQKLLNVKRQKD